MVNGRPLLVSEPRLVAGPVSGGISTRHGFPPATASGPEDPARHQARAILARLVDLPEGRFAWLRQVHGNVVHRIEDGGLAGPGDALVTTAPDLALLIAVADCGPILLWDARSGVLGAAHAGWRGCVAGVAEATVTSMTRAGADPARIAAWVGPCIGPAHFEVGPEVAAQFASADVRQDGGRSFVDLAGAIRRRLVAAGLDAARIHLARQCTFELEDRYWSYRRDGGICGRQLAWITRRA